MDSRRVRGDSREVKESERPSVLGGVEDVEQVEAFGEVFVACPL